MRVGGDIGREDWCGVALYSIPAIENGETELVDKYYEVCTIQQCSGGDYRGEWQGRARWKDRLWRGVGGDGWSGELGW